MAPVAPLLKALIIKRETGFSSLIPSWRWIPSGMSFEMDLFAEEKSKDYDCVVKVGGECIRAHKSVLIEQSNYFKALFCGQFEDSVKNEVDLSEIASNISDVRAVMSFMYTGDIRVEPEHLDDIMKLSSYLSVSSLDKYLEKFLLQTLHVKTCLKYYCLCQQYGFMEVERKAGVMLKARFHDCVIKDENSLDVMPEMLKGLFDNSFLKFCSGAAVLKFLARWVERNPDKIEAEIPDRSKVEVSGHILRSISTESQRRPKSHIQKSCVEDDLTKMKKRLEKEPLAADTEEFLNLFERTVSDLYTKPDPPEKFEEKKSTPVLVTLSLRDMPEKERFLHEKYIYDLCIYSLETGNWYMLTTFEKKDFKRYAAINLTEDYTTVVDAHGKLYLMDGFRNDMATYDYANKVWYYWESISDLVINEEFEHYNGLFLTRAPSGDLYLVVEVLRWRNDIREFDNTEELQEDNILDGYFFIAAKYGKDDETFHEVFRTEMIPVTNKEMEYSVIEMSHCSVKVNKKQEMILVHTGTDSDDNVAVMFDFKEDAPPKIKPFKIEKEYRSYLLTTCILEEEDKFVVINKDNGKEQMVVLFECQYGSDELNFDIDHVEISDVQSSEKFELGTRHNRTVAGRESLWHIGQLLDVVSMCRQVSFKGEPSVLDHTPPPFTDIISAHEMDFPVDILEKLDPITDLLPYEK